MDFPCAKCGLCCRMIRSVPELAEYDNGNGVCRYLENNICSIYESRPQVCNVSEMYNARYASSMAEREFVEVNLRSCEEIAVMFGDESATRNIRRTIDQALTASENGTYSGESKNSP